MVPYDNIGHAGGKTHNYLIKYFQKKRDNQVYLISFAQEFEEEKIDLNHYGIEYAVKIVRNHTFEAIPRKLVTLMSVFSKAIGDGPAWMRSYIREQANIYKKKYGLPDVVILQWTSIGNQIKWLKRIFPNTKFVIIEEDVSYLKTRRKMELQRGIVKKIAKMHYKISKQHELDSLCKADLVVVNNPKDYRLVVGDGIEAQKIFIYPPYFYDLSGSVRNKTNHDILYYGAMQRPENNEAALWFINKIFDSIIESVPDARFIVVGNKPTKELQARASDKIVITGFVDDICPYFESSLCCVAPLMMGAGVKLKIIEAMSSGIPVLTNDIGIEGIDAMAGRDYLHCTTADDYIQAVVNLANNEDEAKRIGMNGKEYIRENYDREKSVDSLYKRFCELL